MPSARQAPAASSSNWARASAPSSWRRRPIDDVTAIELKAVAGATIALVDKSYTPDAAAAAVNDGTSNTNTPYLDAFPYLGTPGGGYQSKPGTLVP